jgi:hypothetical protein
LKSISKRAKKPAKRVTPKSNGFLTSTATNPVKLVKATPRRNLPRKASAVSNPRNNRQRPPLVAQLGAVSNNRPSNRPKPRKAAHRLGVAVSLPSNRRKVKRPHGAALHRPSNNPRKRPPLAVLHLGANVNRCS